MAEHSNLTSRAIPSITLRSPSSPTPTPSDLHDGNADINLAIERFRISGVAVVAGGAGDLSAASSKALLEHGLQKLAIFHAATEDIAKPVIFQLSSDFPFAKITFTKVDITDADAVEKAVAAVVQNLDLSRYWPTLSALCERACYAALHRLVEANSRG